MAEPSYTDILQDRTHKYRRTLMGVCVVLIVLYYFPNLDFSGLSLFGIKPGNDSSARWYVLAALWVAWIYQAFLFAYYAQRDFKDWRDQLSEDIGSWEDIRAYLKWLGPGAATTKRILSGHNALAEDWSWSRSEDKESAKWTCKFTANDHEREVSVNIPLVRDRSVRSRLNWFALVDCGFPISLSALALALALFSMVRTV